MGERRFCAWHLDSLLSTWDCRSWAGERDCLVMLFVNRVPNLVGLVSLPLLNESTSSDMSL